MKTVYEYVGDGAILACPDCSLVYSFDYSDVKTLEWEPGSPHGAVDYYIDCRKCGRALEISQYLVERLKNHG